MTPPAAHRPMTHGDFARRHGTVMETVDIYGSRQMVRRVQRETRVVLQAMAELRDWLSLARKLEELSR